MIRTLLASISLFVALGINLPATAANPVPSRVAPLVTQPIDESHRVVLRGNVHPLAQARFDKGAVPAATPASRLMLLLKHSPTQKAALREYIDSLQDKKSPNFHKWLTPEQFGAAYGASDQDLQTVTTWLQSHGFTVNRVAKARNVIEFSGNAGQVQEAFHASIHSYLVKGEEHFANATDPEIPAALAPIVAGVTQLHNFNPKRHSVASTPARWNPDTRHLDKQIVDRQLTGKQITGPDSSGNESLYVVPADAATLYNTPNSQLNPAYTGTTYDGTGATVGIAGDSNFTMQDVANYRGYFLNDSNPAHLPNIIVDGNDPGIVPGDAVEALLDNEIVGGLAPGAKINFYTAQNTDVQSGLFLAIFRALNDNAIDILNVSFGGCEYFQGQSGNEENYYAWEQAATQGISVTISSGDSGSAGCDDDNTEEAAYNGLAVNGLASTPFAVAVGGTDFRTLIDNYPSSFNQYMKPSGGVAPYYGSVNGYIPEAVWNDSSSTDTTINLDVPDSHYNIIGGGGGVSTCGYEDTNNQCLGGYAKPAYQANLTPADGARDVPDVSFFASNGYSQASWAICSDNGADGTSTAYTDCQLVDGQPTSGTTLSGEGGTSAAAPTFAGILALIRQSTGGRLGNPNPVLYSLAETQPSTFHDVTVGNNSVGCYQGSPNCASNGFLTGYDTATGYDAATGLGSVDVSALLTNWPSVTFTPSSTTLEIGQSTSSLSASPLVVAHGTPMEFSIAINPGASVTGSVTLITDSNVSVMPGTGAPDGFFPVNTNPAENGIVTGGTNALPGGTYNLYAYYGGDTTYAASKSNPVPVTISPEDSNTALLLSFYDGSTGNYLGATTTVPYGSYLFATATPQSAAQPDGTATGTVTFRSGSTTFGSPVPVSTAGTASFNSLSQNALNVGSYQMTASYSGDASYNPSVSSTSAFTITKAQISSSLSAASSGVNYSGSIVLGVSIATDSIGNPPTGSVTFMSGMTVLGTGAIVGGYSNTDGTAAGIVNATIAGTQFPKNGVNSVTAVYSGDANYSGATSNGVGVTVSGVPVPKFGVTGPTSMTVASPGTSTTATLTITPFGGFTGAINLTCAVTGPTGAISVPTCTTTNATITGTAASTATLNIVSTSTTTAGSYSVAVTGVDAATGKITGSAVIPLTVTPAAAQTFALAATSATIASPGASGASTISITPAGGFTGSVALSCSASTAGLTCDPATATVGASSGMATLNIHSTSATAPGTYTLGVNGVDSATGTVTASTTAQVTVAAAGGPTLALSATPAAISAGASATSTVTLTPAGGFTGSVTLTCAMTSGPTGAVSAPSCTSTSTTVSGTAPATSVLTLQTASTTTPGAYALTITATANGAAVATTSVAVTVSAPVSPAGFTLSGTAVAIASLGASGSSTLTLTPTGSFTGQVNLKCAMTSAPAGANDDPTCSFSSGSSVMLSASAPATATMTVTTSTSAQALSIPQSGTWMRATGGATLAGLLFFCVPARRRRRLTMLAGLLLLACGFTIGCGGGTNAATTPVVSGTGAFTFTVTGADAATGLIVSTTTVTVNVQ